MRPGVVMEVPSVDGASTRAVRPPRPREPDQRNLVPRDRAALFFSYIGAVLALAAGVVGADWAWGPGWPFAGQRAPTAFILTAVLAVLVDLRPLSPPGRGQSPPVFMSIAFTFAILVGWGPLPAVVVQTVAVAVSSVRLRHAPWRGLLNAAQYALAVVAAGGVLTALGVPALASIDTLPRAAGLETVLSVPVAACTWFVVSELLVASALWLRFGGRWSTAVVGLLRQNVIAILGLLAVGPFVVAAGNISAPLVGLVLVPMFAVSELARYTETEQRTFLQDDLTGLPNRRALFAEMRAQVALYAQRYGRGSVASRRMALLLLDIDQFRRVNDALGHAVGDRLLIAVADRLAECVGADGFVARLGGDEFGVLAPRLVDQAAARVLAERVAHALADPVTLDGLPLDVTAAIGVAIHPDHGSDNTTLLRRAEIAMYDAKDRSATYAVYTPETDHNSVERLELLADLRRALEVGRSDEVALFYQPQIDMATGAVVGVEALLRWRHPQHGMVSPAHVIKVAEHTAVMRLLTQRVVEDAITQLAAWQDQGQQLRVSINVSARDLHRPEWVDHIADLLADRGVQPNQVQLEITEGALMADPRRVLVTLHRLDKLGVALSLDDFGTGYSSLQHLRRLPLAEVKIDRSFVLGMAGDPDDAAVVGSIIDLARALGLRVVAEGVEDDHTRRMLLAAGCEVAQGWFYARPMPADQLVGWLSQWHPGPR